MTLLSNASKSIIRTLKTRLCHFLQHYEVTLKKSDPALLSEEIILKGSKYLERIKNQ